MNGLTLDTLPPGWLDKAHHEKVLDTLLAQSGAKYSPEEIAAFAGFWVTMEAVTAQAAAAQAAGTPILSAPRDFPCSCASLPPIFWATRNAIRRPGRFLTICEGGNVRSVSMAFVLKEAGQDALAASWRSNPPESLRYLIAWADAVIVMQPEFVAKLPPLGDKVIVVDVGPDTYGHAFHADLVTGLRRIVAGWGLSR